MKNITKNTKLLNENRMYRRPSYFVMMFYLHTATRFCNVRIKYKEVLLLENNTVTGSLGM